jgi:hypothetical protein
MARNRRNNERKIADMLLDRAGIQQQVRKRGGILCRVSSGHGS